MKEFFIFLLSYVVGFILWNLIYQDDLNGFRSDSILESLTSVFLLWVFPSLVELFVAFFLKKYIRNSAFYLTSVFSLALLTPLVLINTGFPFSILRMVIFIVLYIAVMKIYTLENIISREKETK